MFEQFDDLEQQAEASQLGMWIFLATEVLFFGGLFTAYTAYRWAYPESFAAMSRETNVVFGTLNTAVLLTSSLTMALAVERARESRSRQAGLWLTTTALLGMGFLVIKGLEYREDFAKHLIPGHPDFPAASVPSGPAQLFFWLYYAMTGLHALHLLIGITLVSVFAVRAFRGVFSDRARHSMAEVAGLYWHFVDVVWVFLYPLIYLIERHPR